MKAKNLPAKEQQVTENNCALTNGEKGTQQRKLNQKHIWVIVFISPAPKSQTRQWEENKKKRQGGFPISPMRT